MPAMFTTPGAIHVFVKFRGDSQPSFLGNCETSPDVDGDPAYLNVINDRVSRSKPAQKIYDGESHAVTCTMNYFDQLVWKRCMNPMDHLSATTALGTDGRYERGRLVMGIGDFELILVNDFFAQTFANIDLRQGRRYYSSVLGPYREITSGGNRVVTIQARFDCDSLFVNGARTSPLFTEDLSGLTLTPG